MKCFNCGGEIPTNSNNCPYCGETVLEMSKTKAIIDDKLNYRFKQIDKLFGLETDFVSLSNLELEKYFTKIMNELDQIKTDNINNKIYFDEIMKHIDDVEFELQSRFPIKKGLSDAEIASKVNSSGDIVMSLLNDFVPPEVDCAAFKIRSLTEKKLKDVYHFKYGKYKNDGKDFGFEKTYFDMFKIVANQNVFVAKKLCDDHTLLNQFVHSGEINERQIKQKLPTIDKQVEFLRSAYNLRKKYNLV